MTALTVEELKSLINIVSEVTVPIKQQQPFVDIINKMSAMVTELTKPVDNEPKSKV